MTKSRKYFPACFSGRLSIISVFIFIIAASFMSPANALSDNQKDVRISSFKAHYYTENDGRNPGRKNDGTIKDVVSKLQFTESVKRPSINFSYSDFNGINSYNFYGVWEGVISADSEGQSVKAHFDVSKSDVSFYLNDKLLEKWNDVSKIVQFSLNKGDNKIRIELHNHWHTTSFNVSFTDYQKLDKSTAVEVFKGIDFNSTKSIYLGAYEASSRNPGENYNEILVTLPGSPEPIFIFLNSFRAVNWVINNPQNAKIVGIALRGRSPGSTVAITSPAPVYQLPASKNAHKSSYDIQAFIGKNADYAFTEYGFSSIIIPDFFQARAKDAPKRNDSISTSESPGPGRTDKYAVNSFVESLVVQQQNNPVTRTRIVKEPSLDGAFIKGTWKGYVDVSKTTDKSFKISHKGVRAELIIDGKSVWRGKNSRENVYQYTFKPGRHEVMFVAYPEEDSRPAKFDVSITDNAKDLKYDQLATLLRRLGNFDSIYCGVEKSKSPDRRVDIRLHDLGKPVVLFLTSNQQVVWDFRNSDTDRLAAVVTSAKNSAGSIKNLPSHVPVYHFFNLAKTAQFIPVRGKRNIDNTFKSAALQILALTGKLPAGFSGVRETDTVAVPGIVLEREKYRQIGFADVSPDYNIFIEYPDKIDIVFNPVTTKFIDSNSSSEFTQTRPIKPEVQRKSWAEPLGATEDIPTGAFRAYYFDIFNSGLPKFSGIVEDVSISSTSTKRNSTGTASVDDHGIIPENFGAFWIGNINLEKEEEMEINIDSGHSATRVLIDDKVVNGKTISLQKGLHKVEIEHVNNWHTYGFSFSLTEPQTLLAYEELREQLGNILPRKVHTAYVGVYRSKSGDNAITLDIKNAGKPVFLILASAHPVNWVIGGAGAKDIKALLVSSTHSKSKIKGNIKQDIPIFHFPMWNFTYQLKSNCECQGSYYCASRDLFDTIDYVATITGQKIDSFTGNYSAKSFVVPDTIIDKKQFKALSKIAKENRQAQAKCEGPELTPQYLDKRQRKQIRAHPSVQDALKAMKLIRDNRFDEYIAYMETRNRNVNQNEIKEMFLFQHNYFAGYDPSIAYHMIDKKMYEKIIANKPKLTIPLLLKKENLKDHYIKVHMNKAGDRWAVSFIR
ncbi:hypothetical protein HNR65_003628 [Desulfosalsimonas propionicica]|uniref:PA14 domain-containing protein n=1 Tax=Desulfosalsimonas propionicica TaxID=332175 RepID=A0A7W0HMN9_9BACT|nr:hypothetical protein [Desulfosalsimonas propionicica]MBA2883266.1 hypothetical protein [Desulfosalsimonas propionicica]